MKRKASQSFANVTGLAVALVVALAALPAVNARDPGAIGPAAAIAPLSALDAVPGEHFVHVVTSENTSVNFTFIDHPLTNDNPNAIVFATPNWNPGGAVGNYNDHSIGVRYYSGVEKRWVIFNQDGVPFIMGTAFNVLIPNADPGVFVHEATAANTDGRSTYIDHPLTNDNPDAIVFAILNFNPGGGGGNDNDRPIAVFYNPVRAEWAVFNQEDVAMPEGAAFNVLVPAGGPTVFVHRAGPANTTNNYTMIDHPLANDDPDAIVFVTQNFNPGGGLGVLNDQPIGVYYDSTLSDRWGIFNQDRFAGMPTGAAFNVMVMGHLVFLPIIMR
jgi:hypothetical protein